MARKKLKVAILLGGKSSEREISIKTGKNIAENLDKSKYEIKIFDTKDELVFSRLLI